MRNRAPIGSVRALSANIGVTPRLVLLALLPITVLGLVAVPFAASVHGDASTAEAASRDVGVVTKTIAAYDSLVTEETYSVVFRIMIGSGVSPGEAGAVLGVSVSGELATARAATDAALRALPLSESEPLLGRLSSLRVQMDKDEGSAGSLAKSYEAVAAALRNQTGAAFSAAESAVLLTSGSPSAKRALLVLGDCRQLLSAASAEVVDEAATWFVSGAPSTSQLLTQDNFQFEQAGAAFASSGVPSVSQAWAAFENSPSTKAYQALVLALADGGRLPFVDGRFTPGVAGSVPLSTLVGAYSSIGTHWGLISGIVAKASSTVHHDMATLATKDTEAYELLLFVLAFAGTAVLAVAVLAARSISNPLNRLAASARSIVAGNLEAAHLGLTGPREISMVAQAFNEVMANLRLLEAKSRALASCDFDNEVLTQSLPGQLGASLQDSVHVLAGSIQDRRDLQERLAHEATHDTLTGLVNRAASISTLEQALSRAKRTSDITAVLHVDIDNFKQVNELCGHQSGDAILREVGRRLVSSTRSGDVVARLGSDEFLVIAERTDGVQEAEYLAHRLIGALATEPVQWENERHVLSACIGITVCRGEEVAASDVLARADMALYEAKQRGSGAIGVYDEELQQRLASRDRIERDLRTEIASGGENFTIYYQPLVDGKMGLRGAEALLRWNRPNYGMTPPMEFIPIAEASDLIIDLDCWVLEAVCGQMARWQQNQSLAPLRVSVNVSGRHLMSAQLLGHLTRVLDHTGVDPRSLVIEITETVLLTDLEAAAAELEAVRALGVRVAVDDFGTGYTSLAHLHHLPVDSIKIDRMFVSDIGDPGDASVVRMITELARHLGLSTVSEGVETQEQFVALRDLGSDYMQGYLIARPMPAAALCEWVAVHDQSRGIATAEA